MNSLFEAVKSIKPSTFDQTALAVFNYQAQNNPLFQDYLNLLGHKGTAAHIRELVFMPIEFFKSHTIKTGEWVEECVFESSGTTGVQTSRHYIPKLATYQNGTETIFESLYGSLEDYTILALLPSYLERGNSGLIAMVDHFIGQTKSQDSGYYLNDFEDLFHKLNELKSKGRKTILWGVTFALLDFVENFKLDFPELIIMETGGMKGRRKEMVRAEVHERLTHAFGVKDIHSEYGMTELNSQAYAPEKGLFTPAPTMKVMTRDINDPFQLLPKGKTGALNIIDLHNLASCAFIETKDIGRVAENGQFEVMGRMDNSDVRGCNLMVL